MEGSEIAQLINELETRVERLRALYDQYFVGIERLEPLVLRKDVDRRLWVLRREQIRNTALRFKLETTIQRYNTYQQYWQRIVREIENGTYQRDLGRAMKRFGDLGTTALGKRRQKMFEKGMARRAEREARTGRSSAPPPNDSQAPPDPSNPPGETPISNGPPRVPSPPPPSAGAALTEEWEDVDLELELQSSRPPPPLAADPAAATKPVAAIPAAAPPPRIAIPTGAQAPPSAASSPLPQRGPIAPTAPMAPTAPARVGAASPMAKPQTPARPLPPVAKPATAPVAKPAAAPVPKPATGPIAKPATAAAKPQTQVPAGTSKPQPAGPPATAPAPAQKPPPAKPPAAQPAASTDDLSAGRMRQIYGQYVEAKRRANESTAALTYEKVAANLQQTAQTLRAKHGSQSVDFEVVLKNGKPAIKPILKG